MTGNSGEIFVKIVGSIVATVVFIIAWAVASTLTHVLFALMGTVYGGAPTYFTLAIAAGISGYYGSALAALLIDKMFKSYSKNAVFYVFAAFVGLISFYAVVRDLDEEDYFHLITMVITAISACYAAHSCLIKDEDIFR